MSGVCEPLPECQPGKHDWTKGQPCLVFLSFFTNAESAERDWDTSPLSPFNETQGQSQTLDCACLISPLVCFYSYFPYKYYSHLP